MPSGYYSLAGLISHVLGILAFVAEVYALVDAARNRADAFIAAGKLTKPLWLTILGVATAVGLVFLLTVFATVSLIAFVAAAVYLVDVRPALRQVSGRGGGNNGGYGRW